MIRRSYLIPGLLLLLFGQMSEMLPSLHDHQNEHHCIELGGLFYKLTAAEQEQAEGPSARGLRLDANHHHDICALCQMVPNFLPVGIRPWQPGPIEIGQGDRQDHSRAELFQFDRLARGPPLA